jgi:exonuclease VII small subunit
MWRKGVLIFLVLMAVATASGYFYLTEKIAAGDLKIAAGKKQLADGEKLLAQGKTRLAEGQGSLSQAKGLYHGIKSVPLMGIVKDLPISGTFFSIAHGKIQEGNDLVKKGQEKIKNGEKQLSEGKLDLSNGERKLKDANNIRIACGVSAIVFTLLAFLVAYKCKYKRRKK